MIKTRNYKNSILFLALLILYTTNIFAIEVNKEKKVMEDVNFYQPLYMQNKITDNLWINQPIKEFSRYHNFLYSISFTYVISKRSYTDAYYLTVATPTAAIAGGVIGLSKAAYHQFFSSNSNPKFRKPILFVENGVVFNDRAGSFTKLALRKQISFIDEIGIKYGFEEYYGSNLINVHLEITDYRLDNEYINLFYSLGLGYSDSHYKTEDSNSYEKNVDLSTILQAGIKLNLFDFTYFKAGWNYHYTPILDTIADKSPEHDDSIKSNFVFIIGTELF